MTRGRHTFKCEICESEIVESSVMQAVNCSNCGTLYEFKDELVLMLSDKQIECLKRHISEWNAEGCGER